MVTDKEDLDWEREQAEREQQKREDYAKLHKFTEEFEALCDKHGVDVHNDYSGSQFHLGLAWSYL